MKSSTLAVVIGAGLYGVFGASGYALSKDKIDSGLYATYSIGNNGGTSISMFVCGVLPDSNGCYAQGSMSPFESACAVLEGKARYRTVKNGEVVRRAIYVLDRRTSSTDSAILYVYTRTDKITDDTYDAVSLNLTNQTTLPITGGASAKCFMGANDVAVYVGTDQGGAVAVNKKTLLSTKLIGPGITSIMADERGYVAVNGGNLCGLYDPQGNAVGCPGAGNQNVLDDRNAWRPN
jgi:hypothetical protein